LQHICLDGVLPPCNPPSVGVPWRDKPEAR
jgi:hypothetical protein